MKLEERYVVKGKIGMRVDISIHFMHYENFQE